MVDAACATLAIVIGLDGRPAMGDIVTDSIVRLLYGEIEKWRREADPLRWRGEKNRY